MECNDDVFCFLLSVIILFIKNEQFISLMELIFLKHFQQEKFFENFL